MATQVFKLPESLKGDVKYSFCPGCDHGVAVRLVAEVIDELGIRENTILSASISQVSHSGSQNTGFNPARNTARMEAM